MKKKMSLSYVVILMLIGSLIMFAGCNGGGDPVTGEEMFNITVTAPPGAQGTFTVRNGGSAGTPIVGTVQVANGTELYLSAIPTANHNFVRFTANNVNIGTTNPMSFIVSSDVTLAAVFQQLQPGAQTVTVNRHPASAAGTIIVESNNSNPTIFFTGDEATLTVTVNPASGYTLDEILIDGEQVTPTKNGNVYTYVFNIGFRGIIIDVKFSGYGLISYDITFTHVVTRGRLWVTVAGSAETNANTTATIGQLVTLRAQAERGYYLSEFTVNGTSITGNTFYMPNNNVTVEAIFGVASEWDIDVDITLPQGSAYIPNLVAVDTHIDGKILTGDVITVTVNLSHRHIILEGLTVNEISGGIEGNAVTVTPGAAGVFTFTMPHSDVILKVSFRAAVLFNWDFNETRITNIPQLPAWDLAVSELPSGNLILSRRRLDPIFSLQAHPDLLISNPNIPSTTPLPLTIQVHEAGAATPDGAFRLGEKIRTDFAASSRIVIGGVPGASGPAGANTTNNTNQGGGYFDLSEGWFRLTIHYREMVSADNTRIPLRVSINNNTAGHNRIDSVLGERSMLGTFVSWWNFRPGTLRDAWPTAAVRYRWTMYPGSTEAIATAAWPHFIEWGSLIIEFNPSLAFDDDYFSTRPELTRNVADESLQRAFITLSAAERAGATQTFEPGNPSQFVSFVTPENPAGQDHGITITGVRLERIAAPD